MEDKAVSPDRCPRCDGQLVGRPASRDAVRLQCQRCGSRVKRWGSSADLRFSPVSDDIDVPVNAWEKAPDPKQLDARLPRRHRMIVRAMRRQLERRVRRGQDLFRDRP